MADMGMVIEGVYTTKAAYEMSQDRHVEMPIIESIYKYGKLMKDNTLKDQFNYLVGGYFGIREMDEYELKVYILKEVEE